MEWPTTYQFEGDDEKYMIGSEVGSCLNLYKGALYKRFPKLWRRVITKKEKKVLADLGVNNRVLANWEVMFIKASEGESILKGQASELKGTYAPRTSKQPIYSRNDYSIKPTNAKKAMKGSNVEMHLGPLINSDQRNGFQVRQKNWKRREFLRRNIIFSR